MNIKLTSKNINDIFDDESFKHELIQYLNDTIDNELEKGDNMNTGLIDDCIDTLDRLQSENNIAPTLRLVLTEKQVIKYCHKNAKPTNKNYRKAAVAACFIILLSSGVMLSTNPVIAQQTKEFFSDIISALSITADQSKNGTEPNISSIYARFPEGTSFFVQSEDDIDLSKMQIFAIYKDNTEREIKLSNCTVNITKKENSSEILVVIAYDGCAFSVIYTLEE